MQGGGERCRTHNVIISDTRGVPRRADHTAQASRGTTNQTRPGRALRVTLAVMISHAPENYRCPFCRNLAEGVAEHPLEILYRDDDVFVKMNPKWWPNNPGNVLVIPTQHYENIFDLPPSLGTSLQRAARAAAIAMKAAYSCDGVSTRQHNEPAGNQKVWHYHLHVFPRWVGDDFYRTVGELAPHDQLRERASRLRACWPTIDDG